MGNFLGIFSDIGKSIGTADTMQRKGKVLKNAAKGAANGVRKIFKKGNHNLFKDVRNSAKKFVNGFGNGLIGQKRGTHYREIVPLSPAGVIGSIAAHEYLRKQKKKIKGLNSSEKSSIFNISRKNTGVKSEEQQPPQENNKPLNTNPISSIENSLQQSSLQPKNVNPYSNKNNNLLKNSPQHNNTSIKKKPNSKIENSSQQYPAQPKNVNNNFIKKNNSLKQPSETINPISSIMINQNLQKKTEEIQKGGNKKKSSKKNLSEDKKKTSKK
jgi:hypothetical protein